MEKNKALYEMKRGFRLIFQAGGPAFLRFPPLTFNGLYQLGKNKLRLALNQQETMFSTTAKKG